MAKRLPADFQSALDATLKLFETLHKLRRLAHRDMLECLLDLLDDPDDPAGAAAKDGNASAFPGPWREAANRLSLESSDAKRRLETIIPSLECAGMVADCDEVSEPTGCETLLKLAHRLLELAKMSTLARAYKKPPATKQQELEFYYGAMAEELDRRPYDAGQWRRLKAQIVGEIRQAAATAADNETDNGKKIHRPVPDNPDVAKLAKKIKRELPHGGTKKDIALDFTDGDEQLAKSLLRQLQPSRYGYLLD